MYLPITRHDASQILASILSNFTELNWIPWTTGHGPLLYPQLDPNLREFIRSSSASSSDHNTQHILALARSEWNSYHGMRNVYLRSGWPENFRGEDLEKARDEWNREVERLEAIQRGLPILDYEGEPRVQRLADGMEEWLRNRAGNEAI